MSGNNSVQPAALSAQISAKERRARRDELARRIGSQAVAIIPAARNIIRNSDVHYPFRQDSDFRYLCNFPEPDALLLIMGSEKSARCVLFCAPRDKTRELWDGPRIGAKDACDYSEVDESHELGTMDELIPGMLAGRNAVYCQTDSNAWLQDKLRGWISNIRQRTRSGIRAPGSVIDLSTSLHEMRLIKSSEELDVMRVAGSISIDAHARAMTECAAGGWEHQLEAALCHEFSFQGACHWAYPAIVGSGHNACVLHYTDNNAPLHAGDSVLIDAGCEVDGYASDISRSFPVDGTFSSKQHALYTVVLAAQQAAIDTALPGKRFSDVHDAAVDTLLRGLLDLGLLKGNRLSLMRDEQWRRFFPHRTGHWLGLDVHDVGAYTEEDGESRILVEGMVMTVEPGLYVQPSDKEAPASWRGIGMRIEDDIVVCEGGSEILNPPRLRDPQEVMDCVGQT
jgi:Xaa-Pro aminopeptidase